MSTPGHLPARAFEADDAELTQYQAVCGLALVGLVGGLLSVLALLDPLLWLIPLVTVVICFVGLRRIRRQAPALTGRQAALVGLFLAILFGTAGPTEWLVHRWQMRREARQFAELWFELLRHGEPQMAYQLCLDPKFRKPLDEKLWGIYNMTPQWHDDLRKYAAQPLVRSLLALGPKAQIRYYDAAGQEDENGRPLVQLIYAVSYDDRETGHTSFFVAVTAQRSLVSDGQANWRIASTLGGIRPDGW